MVFSQYGGGGGIKCIKVLIWEQSKLYSFPRPGGELSLCGQADFWKISL